MSFWKRLFASPDVIASTVKSAIGGLDDLVYTDQEKAEMTQRGQDLYSKMWMAALPSALSRRMIAVMFVATFCLLIFFCVIAYALGAEDTAEFTFRVLSQVLQTPVNVIIGFYFLKQIVSEYRTTT